MPSFGRFSGGSLTPAASAAKAASDVSQPTIAYFGHSFQHAGNHGWRCPWGANQVGAITGIGFVGLERNSGDAARVLSFDAETRSCSIDGGPWTPLVDGFQIIPGPAPLTGVGLVGELDGLQATDGTITLTRTGARPDEIVDSKSVAWWTNVFAHQGYLVRVYGHGGGEIQHCAPIVARAEPFHLFVIDYVTNDIGENDSLDNMKAEMLEAVGAAYKKSLAKKGVVLKGCVYRTGFSAAQSELMEQFNRWLDGALRAFPGVVARHPWSRMIDATGVAGNPLMISSDNTHASDPCAQYAGHEIFEYFDSVSPGTPFDFGAGLGRWSATNPAGNMLLNPNPVGNNAGQPSAWGNLAVGANGTATASKVARTDGVAGEWAQISGSATADNVQHVYTIPWSAFAGSPVNGQTVQSFVEVSLSGPLQMVPLLLLTELKAGNVVAFSRVNQSDTKALQMTEWTGVIATPPYVWSDKPGAPTADVRVGQRLMAGAANALLRIGRCWVGEPVQKTIF